MDISHLLTKEHIAAGITLEEDDDILTMSQGQEVIARFGHYAELKNIHYAADQAMEWQRSGITFGKEV